MFRRALLLLEAVIAARTGQKELFWGNVRCLLKLTDMVSQEQTESAKIDALNCQKKHRGTDNQVFQ